MTETKPVREEEKNVEDETTMKDEQTAEEDEGQYPSKKVVIPAMIAIAVTVFLVALVRLFPLAPTLPCIDRSL